MKKFIRFFWMGLLGMFLLVPQLFACFDTYLFIHRSSMVYPYHQLVLETFGEYSFNSLSNPEEDAYLVNFNGYYGVTARFSIQAGLFSSEKSRSEFRIDTYGIRWVYNLYRDVYQKYFLDVILAHEGNFDGEETMFHISAPNMFYNNDWLLVLHPTFELYRGARLKKTETTFGGHLGLFRIINNAAILGLGAEYASPQSGSVWNKRLVDGEIASSLFLGTRIGNFLYLQSEFAKGLSNSRDFGYALTLKFIL